MAKSTRPMKRAAPKTRAAKTATSAKPSKKKTTAGRAQAPHQQAWRDFLEAEHAASSGVWLKVAKLSSGIPSVTHPEALDVALCYGWIDGQRLPLDDTAFLQKFTPRRPKSPWSKINTRKVELLIAQKLMMAAGLREIERAKADGRWESAYDSHREISIPPDLQAQFDRNPKAQAFFATLTGTRRYAFLYRIHSAKKPETRARRIEEFVRILEQHRTLPGTDPRVGQKRARKGR
jgi:uncharacterized protein YdeI (YjbR/CyaY-like superfamily)